MSEAECIMNLVFHVTVISPLADFIGSTGGGKVAKNIFRDDALHYLRGDYLSPLPAPEWIQEVFQKAHCWEIKRVMESRNVNEAYARLCELRYNLVQRWAAAHAPRVPPSKPPEAKAKKPGRRGKRCILTDNEELILGLTVKEAAERTGMTMKNIRNAMYRYGMTTDGYGGPIIRK